MFKRKKILRVHSLLLILSIGFLPLKAITPKKSKSGKRKTTTSAITTKKVQLVQSPNNIELTTNSGDVISLPKIDKTLVDQSSIMATSNDLMADAGFSKSFDELQKLLIQKQEMQELSSVLGINIPDASHLDLYREVADWLGTKYRRGGMSRKAVDCSGFTNVIYKNVFGQQLDRVSTVIAKNLKEPVEKEDLIPGDMVFFSTFGKKYINHVGVYIGDGKFVHASIKKGVIVSSLVEGYYSKTWRKGGRN